MNRTSAHIVGTSANLLGFCLIVITSLHIANRTETHVIDFLTSIIVLLLTFSCVFPFVSIRSLNLVLSARLETLADHLFFVIWYFNNHTVYHTKLHNVNFLYHAFTIKKFLQPEDVQLLKLQKIVQEAIAEEKSIVENLLHEPNEVISTGQSISDKVASFGGSWKFVIIFSVILFTWIFFNPDYALEFVMSDKNAKKTNVLARF